MKVAVFLTCLNDTLFPQTGRALVALLERLGVDVDFPADQTCCGQMHANAGYAAQSTALLRRFADVFAPYDAIVSPSASCVAAVRSHLPRLGELGERVASNVYELSELLLDRLGVDDVGATYEGRVALHPTCHSLRVLGIGDRPERLLRSVRALELVPLPDATECCGFGGTFAVKNPTVSAAILADKIACIAQTNASACVAVDNSCLMHIAGGLRRNGHGIRTLHLAEVLAGTA